MIDKIVIYRNDDHRRTFVMLAFALLLIICISTRTIVNSLPTVTDDDHLDDELDQLNEDIVDDEVDRVLSDEKKSVEEETEKTESPHNNQCRYLGLIHCFTESLDDWALHLWNFRDNIAALDQTSCGKRHNMDYCINYPGCTRQEIVNASRSVTDLLLHRRHTGTFLKSYFYSGFPCSSQGRMIVGQTQNCLVHARISQKAAWLSNYVERQIYARLKKNVPTGR
uniref:Uncharacterized protein n=1 Tax=Romanomermis culicivorax TaxID=13658 RepID=A0A915JK20_ROMCU